MLQIYLFCALIFLIFYELFNMSDSHTSKEKKKKRSIWVILFIVIYGVTIAVTSYILGSEILNYVDIANTKKIGYKSDCVRSVSENTDGQSSANFEIEFNNALNGANVKVLYGEFEKQITTSDLIFLENGQMGFRDVGDVTIVTKKVYLNKLNFSTNVFSIKGDLNNLDIAVFVEDEIVYRDKISLVSN